VILISLKIHISPKKENNECGEAQLDEYDRVLRIVLEYIVQKKEEVLLQKSINFDRSVYLYDFLSKIQNEIINRRALIQSRYEYLSKIEDYEGKKDFKLVHERDFINAIDYFVENYKILNKD
jgi:hypothetical protein